MTLLKRVKTLASNPTILKRYLKWQAARLADERFPSVYLPQGEKLFSAGQFNDFHAISTQHPDHSEYRLMDLLLTQRYDDVTFVDVGANVGAMSLLAHSTGRTKCITAFEPSHFYASIWHKNIKFNNVDNAILIQAAVGHKNGQVSFCVDPSMPLNHKIDCGEIYKTH